MFKCFSNPKKQSRKVDKLQLESIKTAQEAANLAAKNLLNEQNFVKLLKSIEQYQGNVKTEISELSKRETTKLEKLQRGMKHLYDLRPEKASQYIVEALPLMQILDSEFKNDQYYKVWVRFCDIIEIKAMTYQNEELEIFKKDIQSIFKLISTKDTNSQEMDWRISRKIDGLKPILAEQSSTVNLKSYKAGVILKIEQAVNYLEFQATTFFTKLAKNTLKTLEQQLSIADKQKDLESAFITGRFDRKKFNLKYTVILGGDGNMWLLLNSLEEVEKELENDHDYQNIIKKYGLQNTSSQTRKKIIIRKDESGTFRLGLSLFSFANLVPGQLICVRKMKKSASVSTSSALEDLLSNEETSNFIYTPQIYDLARVFANKDEGNHSKDYLMMEVTTPQTAEDVFKSSEYQKWDYQKPYLLDVFSKYHKLSLQSNIVMDQVTITNTLFDTNNLKSTLINMHYRKKGTTTEENSEQLSKACGMIMKEVTRATDFNPKASIDTISDELIKGNMPLIEAISEIKMLGNDKYKENIIFNHYIAMVRERLYSDNRASIGINQDIYETKELLIDQYITPLDPYKYQGLPTIELPKEFDSFFTSKETNVMALFGAAGSGKSIALQLKYIEAVEKWVPGKKIPIYFNLANNVDLEAVISSLNAELGTNLSISTIRNQNFYIDSFDEGIGIEERRDTLIRDYVKTLGNAKLFITCRTDYIRSDDDLNWFKPNDKALAKTCFITPINYTGHSNLTDYINKYLKTKAINGSVEKVVDTIDKYKLREFIDTGFMFHIIMEVVDYLSSKGTAMQNDINRYNIYQMYLSSYMSKKSINKEQERVILQNLQSIPSSSTLQDKLSDICRFIACELHLTNSFRISQNSSLFDFLNLDPEVPFKNQITYHILKYLPLKIETKSSDSMSQQKFNIGFIHDTVKNYYLLKSIISEIASTNYSTVLALKNIVEDSTLIRLFVDAMESHPFLQNGLKQGILRTKTDKSKLATIYAANCITILVASRYSFSNEDLSDVSIEGAKVRNGIFRNVNFSNANLMNVNLCSTDLYGALFVKTNLRGVQFGQRPVLYGHNHCVLSLSYSPDGKFIASGSIDKTVKIWDTQTGKCLQNLIGHTDQALSVSYSPDGKFLASGSEDKNVKIWDTQTGKCLQNLTGHKYPVKSVSYSPDGKFLASGSEDRTLKIWDTQTWNCLRDLTGHTGGVNSVSYSPDGKFIASASLDTTVKIWDTQTGKCLQDLTGHTRHLYSVSYSPNGKFLASGSADITVKIWDTQTGKCLQNLTGLASDVESVSYSPNGKFLAFASSHKVEIRDTQTSKCLQDLTGHTGGVNSVSYSPNGKFFAACSDDETVKIWDTQTGKCLQDFTGHPRSVRSVIYSHDGKFIASGCDDSNVRILDTQTGKCLQNLKFHQQTVNSLSYSPDDKFLASGSEDKTVVIWDTQTWKRVRELTAHNGPVASVSYSPNGKFLVSGSADKTVKIWDTQTWQILQNLIGHTDHVLSVSYSPDSKFLASGSVDKSVKIWDPQTGKCLQNLTGYTFGIRSVSYSPDGKFLASASLDTTVKVWDTQTWKCVQNFTGHNRPVLSVTYSPDGKFLASGSNDKSVKIWDTQSVKCLEGLTSHSHNVKSVSPSTDDKSVESGSEDNTAKLWSLNISKNFALKLVISSQESDLQAQKIILKNSTVLNSNIDLLQQHSKNIEDNIILDDSHEHREDEKPLYLNSKGVEALLQQIILNIRDGNNSKKSNITFGNIENTKPEDLHNLALSYEILGERNLALAKYEEGITKTSNNFRSLLRKGKCLNELEQYEQALDSFCQAFKTLEKEKGPDSISSSIKKVIDLEQLGCKTYSNVASNTFWKIAWKLTMMKMSRLINKLIEDLLKQDLSRIEELQGTESQKISQRLEYLQKKLKLSLSNSSKRTKETLQDDKRKISSMVMEILKKEEGRSQNSKNFSLLIFDLLQDCLLREDVWKYFSLMSRETDVDLEQKEQPTQNINLLDEIRSYLADYCANTNKNKGINVKLPAEFDQLNVQYKYEIKGQDIYKNAKDFDESFIKLNKLYDSCEARYNEFKKFMNWEEELDKQYKVKMHYAANQKSKFRVFQKHREIGYDPENNIFLTNAHGNIWDILRCTFFVESNIENVEKDAQAILELFKKKNIKIVRMKNKINTHLQYIMVNFIWEGLACELQVCFNLNKENKFELHFAYELERCTNLSELFFTLLQTKPLSDDLGKKLGNGLKAGDQESGVLEMFKEMNNIVEIFSK